VEDIAPPSWGQARPGGGADLGGHGPGSAYIKDIFARPLPADTPHHLVFTFSRDSVSFGVSDDRAVTVASQLGQRGTGGRHAHLRLRRHPHRGAHQSRRVQAGEQLLETVR
jgi:hypothetical protein